MFRIARTFYGVKGFRGIEAWSPLSSADPGVLRKLARSAPWHRALRRGGYSEGATQRGEVILGLGGRASSVTGGRWWRGASCRGGWWLGHESARRECIRPSFGVNDTGNYWHCFAGCGGGTVIDLWIKWRECDSMTAITESTGMRLQREARMVSLCMGNAHSEP